MFGPPFSMDKAYKKVESSDSAEEILKKEHGFILRSGLEALEFVKSINAGKDARAAMYGSMVEMSIESFQDQTVQDLLNRRKHTYIDKQHHLQVCFVDSWLSHDANTFLSSKITCLDSAYACMCVLHTCTPGC